MSEIITCGCNPDQYVPCEEHSTVLAQREGASLRTSDELNVLFLEDLADALGEPLSELLSVAGHLTYQEAVTALAQDGSWIDDRDLADDLRWTCDQAEGASGLGVLWEDGYVIFRITGGPLF